MRTFYLFCLLSEYDIVEIQARLILNLSEDEMDSLISVIS